MCVERHDKENVCLGKHGERNCVYKEVGHGESVYV